MLGLQNFHIGCVPYLNALPLREGVPEGSLSLEVPSILSKNFLKGMYDAALLPVYDLFFMENPLLVKKIGISSSGEVSSVFFIYRGKIEEVKEVVFFQDSRTSQNLLWLCFHEWWEREPPALKKWDGKRFPQLKKNQGALFIGDLALEYRQSKESSEDTTFIDLGDFWTKQTGLPFVYALWIISSRMQDSDVELIAEKLRACAIQGMEKRLELERANILAPKSYLFKNILYEIGEEQRKGILLFGELLAKHGLCEKFDFSSWRWV